MLVGNINNRDSYGYLTSLHAWQLAFKALGQLSQHPFDVGDKLTVHGEEVYALVQEIKESPEKKSEAHREYMDIHCCLSGRDCIAYSGTVATQNALQPFDTERDFSFYERPDYVSPIVLNPGDFAVFHPGECHIPGFPGYDINGVKVVVKIRKTPFLVLGPYSVEINYDRPPLELFEEWLSRDLYARIDRAKLTPTNFRLARNGGTVKRDVYLVNLGEVVHQNDLSQRIEARGYKTLPSEWVLAFGKNYPFVSDEHIIISDRSTYVGSEDVTEVICLHNDAGNKRARTHYADTNWGPHIWVACEKIR